MKKLLTIAGIILIFLITSAFIFLKGDHNKIIEKGSSAFNGALETSLCGNEFSGFWELSKDDSKDYYQIDADPKSTGKIRILNTEYIEKTPVLIFRASCNNHTFSIDKQIVNGVANNGSIYYTTITGSGNLNNEKLTLQLNFHYSENNKISTEIWQGTKTSFPGINISDYEKK